MVNNKIKNLFIFLNACFSPTIHFLYCLVWPLGLSGLLISSSMSQKPLKIDLNILIIVMSLFFTLLFARIIDEIKDFEYDKINNPDRPLVKGTISFKELYIYLFISLILVITLNSLISWTLLIIAIIDVVYGVLLLWIEKKVPKITNNIILYLFIAYPISFILNIYIFQFINLNSSLQLNTNIFLSISVIVAVFMQYEIGRKTRWPIGNNIKMELYSNVIGPISSAFVSFLFTIYASACCFYLLKPWESGIVQQIFGFMFIIPIIISLLGLIKFIKTNKLPSPKNEKPVLRIYTEAIQGSIYVLIIIFSFLNNLFIF